MEKKFLEIRDRCTCIGVVAIKMSRDSNIEKAYLTHYGFNERNIALIKLNEMKIQYDPFMWKGPGRTMKEAHLWIKKNFDQLNSGDVVDVEYILGETSIPKKSDLIK